MKKHYVYALIAAAFAFMLLFGCEQQPSIPPAQQQQGSTAQQQQAAAPAQQEGIIWEDRTPSLDDVPADATVSNIRNYIFIFDGSGSMSNECSGTEKKIDMAKKAVARFLDNVPDDVNLGLWVFSDNYHDKGGNAVEVVPLGSNNRKAFLDGINSVVAKESGTPLAQGIVDVTQRLVPQYKKQLGDGEYNIVIVTDGQANYIPKAAKFAIEHGWILYTIGFCIEGQDHPLRQWSYSFADADDEESLTKAMTDIVVVEPDENLDF